MKEVRNAIESPLNSGRFITITGELVCWCIVPTRIGSNDVCVCCHTGPKCAGKSVLVQWACGDIGQVRWFPEQLLCFAVRARLILTAFVFLIRE